MAAKSKKMPHLLHQDYSGHLYIASHPNFPGILKIGTTGRDPQARIRNMSGSVPVSYRLEYAVQVSSRFVAERRVHQRLAECRVDPCKEFFRVSFDEARLALDQAESEPEMSFDALAAAMTRAFAG